MRNLAALDPAILRGAWWAASRLLVVRRRVKRDGLRATPLAPPRLAPKSAGGVNAVLTRSSATCLERALLAQAFHAGQGRPRSVVIGVTAPSAGFHAHAWLDGDDACHDHTFTELTRLEA